MLPLWSKLITHSFTWDHCRVASYSQGRFSQRCSINLFKVKNTPVLKSHKGIVDVAEALNWRSQNFGNVDHPTCLLPTVCTKNLNSHVLRGACVQVKVCVLTNDPVLLLFFQHISSLILGPLFIPFSNLRELHLSFLTFQYVLHLGSLHPQPKSQMLK